MCGSNPHLAGSGTTPNILNSMNFWIVDNLSSFGDTTSQTISQQHYNTIHRMQKESSKKKFITVRYWKPTFTLFHIYMICGYGYSFRSSLHLSYSIYVCTKYVLCVGHQLSTHKCWQVSRFGVSNPGFRILWSGIELTFFQWNWHENSTLELTFLLEHEQKVRILKKEFEHEFKFFR